MSKGELIDKVIAVTGASKGLGAVFARTLAAQGALVALLARPSPELDAMARGLSGALRVECDVASPDSVRAAFRRIEYEYGKLDALINNAATFTPVSLEQASDANIQYELAVNLIGPALCIRSAIPLLRAAGGGDIINISSESVRRPFPKLTVYASAKAGLETLSAGLREELRTENIRVGILRSGVVATGDNLHAHWTPDQEASFYEAMQTTGTLAYVGRPVTPVTIANMLVHLLSLPREAAIDLMELRAI